MSRATLPLLLALFAGVPAIATDGPPTERGEYLARVGNCAGCHTAPDGAPFAGGRHLESPYGTFVTPNITPDPETGIGRWDRAAFRAALKRGRRPDGTPLYPACPYPNFTHASDADLDAIHAYLRELTPVRRRQPGHELRVPYAWRPLVNVWQALYFEPGALPARRDRSADWRRGRYLVEGLGHCAACHRTRGILGATDHSTDAPGGRVRGWYAPSLYDPDEAGLQDWPLSAAADFLRAGKHGDASMLGPMAEVTLNSLQHLRAEDARAMASYLTALPVTRTRSPRSPLVPSEAFRRRAMTRGQRIYDDACADCHGDDGGGDPGAPALAGNRAVRMNDTTNLVNIVRRGGFPPATGRHPRPHGMPPFGALSNDDMAAVLTYIRGSWGNDAPPVPASRIAP